MSPGARRSALVAAAAGIAILAGLAYIAAPKGRVSTDDAYVEADRAYVSPAVRGLVTDVLVAENARVSAGQALVRLDATEFDIRERAAHGELLAAQAAEAGAASGLARLKLQEQAAEGRVRAAEALAGPAAAADPALRQAFETARDQSLAAAHSAAELESARASAQAEEIRARADIDAARLARGRAEVAAPADGVVAAVTVAPGSGVEPGMRLMTLIRSGRPHVVANFKETDVGDIRPGQPATVTVDALRGVRFSGVVESLAPGAGSQFGLLPFEPGNGNFTKVVQRIAVRIRLDPDQSGLDRLRAGLSCEVSVRVTP